MRALRQPRVVGSMAAVMATFLATPPAMACSAARWSANVGVTTAQLGGAEQGFPVAEGSCALALPIGDRDTTVMRYVQDDSPQNEAGYLAEFAVFADSLTAIGDFAVLVAQDGSGQTLFSVGIKQDGDGPRLSWRYLNGDMEQRPLPGPLLSGWSRIGVEFQAGSGNGQFTVALNGAAIFTASDLLTPRGVDAVRFGLVQPRFGGIGVRRSPLLTTPTNHVFLDDFRSSRLTTEATLATAPTNEAAVTAPRDTASPTDPLSAESAWKVMTSGDRLGVWRAPATWLIDGLAPYHWTVNGATPTTARPFIVLGPDAPRFGLAVDGQLAFADGEGGAFGAAGDWPVVGDWNGDGQAQWAVYRPTTGQLCVDHDGNRQLDDAAECAVVGEVGDLPAAGDFDGDGVMALALYRPHRRAFVVNGVEIPFPPGDAPVVGDWNGDGRQEWGVYRRDLSAFYLDMNGNFAWDAADVTRVFGKPGDLPVVYPMPR